MFFVRRGVLWTFNGLNVIDLSFCETPKLRVDGFSNYVLYNIFFFFLGYNRYYYLNQRTRVRLLQNTKSSVSTNYRICTIKNRVFVNIIYWETICLTFLIFHCDHSDYSVKESTGTSNRRHFSLRGPRRHLVWVLSGHWGSLLVFFHNQHCVVSFLFFFFFVLASFKNRFLHHSFTISFGSSVYKKYKQMIFEIQVL